MVGLLAYIRHKSACNLQAVRDNPPWDDLCNCGLRETWRDAVAGTLHPDHIAQLEAIAVAAFDVLPECLEGATVLVGIQRWSVLRDLLDKLRGDDELPEYADDEYNGRIPWR